MCQDDCRCKGLPCGSIVPLLNYQLVEVLSFCIFQREKSPERWESQQPTLELHSNPSGFSVYAIVRQSVLEEQIKETAQVFLQACNGPQSDTESDEDSEEKTRDGLFRIPKVGEFLQACNGPQSDTESDEDSEEKTRDGLFRIPKVGEFLQACNGPQSDTESDEDSEEKTRDGLYRIPKVGEFLQACNGPQSDTESDEDSEEKT